MAISEHEAYLLDMLAEEVVTHIRDEFLGYGEQDELWHNLGFHSRSAALQEWKQLVYAALEEVLP